MRIAKTLLIGLIALGSFSVSAQTADEIIVKHVESLGGKEKLAGLKSVRMTGSMNAQGTDINLVMSKTHQIGMRLDLDIMGSANYQLVNDKTGWAFFPVMGMAEPKELEEPAFKSAVHQLDLQGGLVNYKEKGSTVELLGKEKVDGSDAYKIKVTYKNGHTATFFIDEKTNRHVKTLSKTFSNGNEVEVETTYNDFKQTAEGYWFPYSITSSQGTITFDKIEANVNLDSKIFSN